MSKSLDRLFIHQLECKTIIGAFPWEQHAPRQILVDVLLLLNTQSAALKDDLMQTVDYDKVCKTITASAQARRYQLIETLAAHIAQELLTLYPRIVELELTVYKPNAIPEAKMVGITITRSQITNQ